MRELCKCGSGKEMKGYGTFNFSYKGLDLVIIRAGSECEDCSLNKRKIIELIDKYGGKIIIRPPSRSCKVFLIDWDFYCKFIEEERGEDKQSLNDILVALGLFSTNPENNWMITDGLIIINPSWHASVLYFTRECDVKEYAKLRFLNALYDWEIRRISQVIKKSEIIK